MSSVTDNYSRVIATQAGGPEVLTLVREKLVAPKAGELRVRVEAAGVSWGDIMMRRGIFFGGPLKFPVTLGYDCIGRVDAIGDNVPSYWLNRRVAVLGIQLGYTQVAYAPVNEAVLVPDGVDAAEAAAITLNYATAQQMLHRIAKVIPAKRALIWGAAGGTGTALLELGRAAGLELYGAASARKKATVEQYDAKMIDSRAHNVFETLKHEVPEGFDYIFDPFAGAHAWRSFGLLRPGGKLVLFGISDALKDGKKNLSAVAGLAVLLGLAKLHPRKSATLYGIDQVMQKDRASIRSDLETLFQQLQVGKLKPRIAMRMPLVQAAEAHRLIENFKVDGKIILIPIA
jgi:NADPH:quinone reductase-like Zn-dependent oxidoreductase